MSHAIAQTYIAVNEYRTKITAFLLIACACMALYYGANVYAMVSRTIALDSLKVKTTELSSAVGKLDSTYLELSRGVTPDKLSAYGLMQTKVSEFISRSNTSKYVAVSTHEF